jgi:CopG family nickel-responsive transcriptional regulator
MMCATVDRSGMAEDLDRISLTLPSEMVDRLDDIADDWEYASRSEAIRDALRDFFVAHDWEAEDTARHYGSVVVVHDHDHDSDLPGKLQSIQHEMAGIVTSVQHVHLSEHQCMETIVVDGSAGEIQTMANRLRALEGVQQVKVVAVGGERDRRDDTGHHH